MAEPTQSQLEELLRDVMEELVANDDDCTKKRVNGYIKSAMERLQVVAGAPLDFIAPGLPRDLLMARCRYANAQALEMFEKNFLSELVSLNFLSQVVVPVENQSTY